jgi:hypothetical protein
MSGAYIGPDYSGGTEFPSEFDPNVTFCPPNISPDPETGHMRNWSEDQFISRFRQGALIKDSMMPWISFKTMSDDDLRAIWNYLKTVKPIKVEPKPMRTEHKK